MFVSICRLKFLLLWFNLCIFSLIFGLFLLRKYILKKKEASRGKEKITQVGFFHPYCNAGGGGERVLWCAVRSLQQRYGENIHIKIYTGDKDVTAEKILQNARTTFNVAVDEANLDFVFLTRRRWVEADCYPHFTLLFQSLGSIVLGLEALLKYQPDVYIDTMGYAFTMPLFRYFAGCKVGSYTHYPIISTDMLKRVKNRVLAHNNQNYVTQNPFLTWLKLTYYKLFAKVSEVSFE